MWENRSSVLQMLNANQYHFKCYCQEAEKKQQEIYGEALHIKTNIFEKIITNI